MNNVLVLGSGGREHAIVASLCNDVNVDKVYCAPGNPGISHIAINVPVDLKSNQDIYDIITKYKITHTIVGPEGPLDNGVVDYLKNKDCKVFGPTQFGAQLESSKLFARNFMERYNVPQPSYFECSCEEEVISVSTKLGFPIVLKADGLAAGKGVIICYNQSELDDAMDQMFVNNKFGDAANKISVEECLVGEEISVFLVCDGENYKILNSAQDHKRVFNDDKGPNTGGMGAYCPSPLFNEKLREKVINCIIEPTINGMIDLGHPYEGFLYIGLMIVDNEPYVIEFNVRLGDPEAQVVLPMINTSFFNIIDESIKKSLNNVDIETKEGFNVCIVLCSKGYPEKYQSGFAINGIKELDSSLIFHAGTQCVNDTYQTNGGRVLNIIGCADNLEDAIKQAYQNVKLINFDGMHYRTDIGSKGLKYDK
ncbi:MAG: phosphoribosylamine--glycine ligase [Candidatus Marinimicrobia bacterium]|nr:phosphoribosylamine--glycine ligase [Candidatus Neomarinimicrobiota bacterium]